MIKNFIYKYKLYLIIASVITILGLMMASNNQKEEVPLVVDALELSNQHDQGQEQEQELETYNVDVKGAVKKPGVYKIVKGSIINDVIEIAGGLKTNAYTNNINLSKKVSDEMVIYVYTKNEYKNLNKENNDGTIDSKPVSTKECNNGTKSADISSCFKEKSSIIVSEQSKNNASSTEDNNTNINSLININTATKEELMSLNGVGESKADCIIEYRKQNGGFKTIEEIKNISGIGEASFAKIKDFITV